MAKFTYNDVVTCKPGTTDWFLVPSNQNSSCRPGEPASICGISEDANGTRYTIEFENGEAIEVHEQDLILFAQKP